MDGINGREQYLEELEQLRKQNAELRSAIAELERDAVGEELHLLNHTERRRTEEALREKETQLRQAPVGIDERKQMEDALRESEEKLRTIFDSSPDSIVVTDLDATIIDCNQAALKMAGVSRKEALLGMNALALIAPKDAERAMYSMGLFLRQGFVKKSEYTLLTKEGREYPAEISTNVVRDAHGKPSYFISIINDITERKQMEKELEKYLDQFEEMVEARTAELKEANLRLTQEIDERCRLEENRDRLANILEATPDFVTTAFPDEYIQYLNGAARKMLGIGEFEEISSMQVRDVYPEWVYQSTIEQAIQTAIRDGIWSGETTFLSRTGREIPVLEVIIAHKQPDGAVSYLSTIARDISERKQAEERQHLSSVVFENVSSGLMVIAADGIIQSVNPAFTWITGFDPEDVAGKDMRWFFHEHYGADISEIILLSLMITGRYRNEVWANHKDGKKYYEGFTFTAIRNDQGEITHYINVFQDITEEEQIRKERRSLREQKARMQRLASLSTLSAGIVHEIGQPLNTIKLLADTMLYLYSKKDVFNVDEFINNLKKISGQADQINLLINQMRSFASVGQITEDMPCSLNGAIKKILDLLGRQLSAHGIMVKTELEENLPEVLGTSNAYEEVVLNLVANAMHALDKASKQEKEIVVKTYLADRQVVMEVSDNATGISEDIKESIFEPLFSTKKPGEGMGLGLSIVQSILERFDGQIEVQNNIRGGATFNLKFPLAEHLTKG